MNEQEYEKFYNLMDESFPKEEVRGFEVQKELLEQNPLLKLLTLKRGDKLLGFMLYWQLETCLFCENFAIDPDERGKNLGTTLMQTLQDMNKTIILEVDLPDDEVGKKRVHFYERLGFKYNDFDYMMPAVSEGEEDKPLAIMSYPERMTAQKFIPYKKEIYREVYGRNTI